MSKRKADHLHAADGEMPPAGRRRPANPSAASSSVAAAAAPAPPLATAAASSAHAAVTHFSRLATVELQLIMQCCDFKTLLSLARCSRFTVAAACHDFAWRALPPLSFSTTVAGLGDRLRGSRLLSHCNVSLRWLLPTEGQWRPDVDEAQLAALHSVPRLVELDVRARHHVSGSELQRLLASPAAAGLTTLHCCPSQMDGACISQLPLHQPRLSTLSLNLEIGRHFDAISHRLLAPLPQLPALTDLSLDHSSIRESTAEVIGRCTSLRRLRLSRVEPEVVFAVLMAPARVRLESLSLDNLRPRSSLPFGAAAAHLADDDAVLAAHVQSWRVSFENLQSLRSLSLQHCNGHDVVLAGAAAALATASALRSLTALRADTLLMDNAGGSLIPLLAAHCPQLRRLHVYEITSGIRHSRGTLAGLPSLSNLSDLRLQCSPSQPIGDELAVGRCASLIRLHLSDIRRGLLHAILRSPQMQRLEVLSLGFVRIDRRDRAEGPDGPLSLDWSVCFANLRSLRALNLEICSGGDQLLAALQAACPPLLCSMRFNHSSGRVAGVVPELQLLPALLVQLPSLRVELIKEPPPPRLASSRTFEKPELHVLYKAWHNLQRQHPDRVSITQLARNDFDPLGTWRD